MPAQHPARIWFDVLSQGRPKSGPRIVSSENPGSVSSGKQVIAIAEMPTEFIRALLEPYYDAEQASLDWLLERPGRP
jgi:hypothetical protein